MLEENKTVELKEKDLKQVAAGEDNTTYKYVFTDKDWIYENSMHTIRILIEENVSTNDGSRKIRCIKSTRGFLDDNPVEIYYSASRLLNCYKDHGGVLNAM